MTKHSHFKDKEAIEHVIEAQAKGIISSSEIHGTEISGSMAAAADASREMALVLLLIWSMLSLLIPNMQIFVFLLIFSIGWSIWKFGRSAWLGWSRLERLHRVLEQERWEIEHNREQEKEELRELYAAKGFEGKLLDTVVDVLMADDNRLLRVMVEEELGLSLATQEHPLKQGLGGLFGSLITAFVCLTALFFFSFYGLIAATMLFLAATGALLAYLSHNRTIPAIIWSIGLGIVSYGTVKFLLLQLFPVN